MSRVDGRKVVGMAFAGIIGALGIGQIYLPYIADRDKLRGLFEEDDMPEEARREMEVLMKVDQAAKMAQQGAAGGQQQQQQQQGPQIGEKVNKGSMWNSFRKS